MIPTQKFKREDILIILYSLLENLNSISDNEKIKEVRKMITAIAFNREIGSKMAINLFYPKVAKDNMKNHKKFLKLISDEKIQKIA